MDMNDQEKRTDQRIRQYMEQNIDVPLPEGYEEYVKEKIAFARHETEGGTNGQSRMLPRVAAVAIVIGVLAVGGMGAYAAVGYVQSRMEQMSDAEKEEYIEDVQDSDANADSFSRALTEAEQERLEDLRQQYENEGRFPERKLLQITSTDQLVPDRVCFEPQTSTFYLPETELTDEDLLEIIDFWYARDYSLTEHAQAQDISQKDIDREIDQETLILTARDTVEKVYHIDLDGVKPTCILSRIYNEGIYEPVAIYTFEISRNNIMYEVCVDMLSGDVFQLFERETATDTYLKETTENIPIPDEVKMMGTLPCAKEMVCDFTQESQVELMFIRYETDDREDCLQGKQIYYGFKNGNTIYEVTYDVSVDRTKGIYLFDVGEFETYKHFYENSEFMWFK